MEMHLAVDMQSNSFDDLTINSQKATRKSEKSVRMKADEIIKKQLEEVMSAEREMTNMINKLDVDQIRKELQARLKDLDSKSIESQKYESEEFITRLEKQREIIHQELKRIESPDFQEKVNYENRNSPDQHVQTTAIFSYPGYLARARFESFPKHCLQ